MTSENVIDTVGPSRLDLVSAVLRDAWRCYRGHLVPVVGLSLLVSAERLAVALELPGTAGRGALLEVPVAAVRILLLVLVVRWLITRDPAVPRLGVRAGWRRVRRYVRRYGGVLALHVTVLVAAAVVADLIPDLLIAPAIPDGARPTYWAVLLAVKNPTIIVFTMIWEVAVLRQALLLGEDPGDPGEDPGDVAAGPVAG